MKKKCIGVIVTPHMYEQCMELAIIKRTHLADIIRTAIEFYLQLERPNHHLLNGITEENFEERKKELKEKVEFTRKQRIVI